MEEEIFLLEQTNTLELVSHPPNTNLISCKWIYKLKRDVTGGIKRYKARLAALDFSQKYGCGYDEGFAPGSKMPQCLSNK